MSEPKSEQVFAFTFPVPLLGQNTEDPASDQDLRYCQNLINFIYENGALTTRKGYVEHSTGNGANAVESLHSFTSAAGVTTLLTGSNGTIYNATNFGYRVGVAGGFSENRWISCQFNNRLILVNGADAARDWNGATLATTAWTGASSSTFNFVASYKDRLYFAEKNGVNIYYGGISAITGGVTAYSVGAYLTRGGSILFMTQWSKETGEANENQFVVVSTNGDCLIYSGDYPGGTWVLARRSVIPKPLSKSSFCRLGGDIIIATTSGVISLADWLRGEANSGEIKISSKVNKEIEKLINLYTSNEDNSLTFYGKRNWVVLNLSRVQGTASINPQSVQYIFDVSTGGIYKFEGLDATSFIETPLGLFFGSKNGFVYKFDVGDTDSASAIKFKMQTRYSSLTTPLVKILKLIRFNVTLNESIAMSIFVHADFNRSSSPFTYEREIVNTPWYDPWGSSWPSLYRDIVDSSVAYGNGKLLSIELSGQVRGSGIKLKEIELIGEVGGLN